MRPTLVPGIRATHTFTVTDRKTVPALYPEAPEFQAMPGVFATGYMVGLLEWACLEVLAPHLEPGEGSLGIHVDFSHVAATLPGQTVTVEAELTKLEGRKATFRVSAHDGVDRISEGTHQRMIVAWERFRGIVDAKAEKAGVPGLAR